MTKPNRKNFAWKKFLGVFALAAIASSGLIFGVQYIIDQNQDSAAANSQPVPLYPGQFGRFTVTYENGGDEDMENPVLEIYVGKALTVKPDSLKDIYDGGTYQIVSSIIQTDPQNRWGTIIRYVPKSANNASSASGTSSSNGNILPVAGVGALQFDAQLNSKVLDPVTGGGFGYTVNRVLSPTLDLEGVSSRLVSSNADPSATSDVSIKIVANTNQTVININDLEDGQCVPDPVVIGNTTTCYFSPQKNGSTVAIADNPTLEDGGIAAKIDTADGNGACEIIPYDEVPTEHMAILFPNRTGGLSPYVVVLCPQTPTTNGTEGVQGVDLTSNTGTLDNKAQVELTNDSLIIAPENVGDGSCTPSTVVIGNNTNCSYPLTDNGTPIQMSQNPTLPTGGVSNQVDTASGTDTCDIVDGGSIGQTAGQAYLSCSTTPTAGGTAGSQGVDLIFPDGRLDNKAQITLEEVVVDSNYGCDHNTRFDEDPNNDECIFYAIGLGDNQDINFDSTTQTNLNYPRFQKFKDGQVTLVFDKIMRSDKQLISDGSTCTFELTRVLRTDILKTYTGTTSGGKCSAVFPVDDQTVNYYTVKITAVDSQNDEKMITMDRHILNVGG